MTEKMTREKALEILQLDISTPTDKIKQKYENFMRRAKFDKDLDTEKITKAYDTLMGYDWGNFEADPAYSEKGLNKKKVENFFYHYKRSLIYGGVAIVLIVSIIVMIITGTTRYDYKISVLGNVSISDQTVIAEYYEKLLNKDSVLIDYYIVGNDTDGAMNENYMFKLMGDIQSGESGLFIIHADYSKFLSYDGSLKDLTPYLSELGIKPDDENLIYWKNDEENEIACAYKFGKTPILNDGISGTVPQYFAIPYFSEYSEETKTVILDLLSQNR